MSRTLPWDTFFRQKITKIFTEKTLIIDIGGGLRAEDTNNRGNENPWLAEYIKKVDYKILDKTDDYHPDLVGDVHDLPLEDNSVDAIICMSLLEHVEEPQKAMREMHRVLKPGGYFFLFVPFLFYYHPMPGYYKDFYRFTYDGVEYLLKDFSEVEIQNVNGALATVMNLFPTFSKKTKFFSLLDKVIGKEASRQTSGYNAFAIK